ncbi:unnamed protein product [Rotaria magnacalcarata]|uniref:Uncharacterized protein n=2 Tax=Rotaria TaxID=231623 RepID=A0A819ZLK3_9BILA|nr:unnamed protein product [Rotaria magnacalcarata]CAF3399701.1 unnamed protein product [Rotaria socialis]CAF1375238.1 unnamed protein product [Rotaria magnacalcarata]CAF2089589.1 unnamed protein product [Rotaria magnacalcarata]CAF2111132.1 unnamed protein product [Rotaria magnacalcarata]
MILANICLTIYFIVSNAQHYEKYKERDSYVVYHVANTSSDYYIIRANMNDTVNCSSNALFTFDVSTVYKNIISKEGRQNLLFITVYWLSTIVAVLISIFDIILALIDQCMQHHIDYENVEENELFAKTLLTSIGSQFLQKGSFIFPTYFINIFDYTKLCLPHHTKASLFILHHTYIGIVISLCGMGYLILWTFACWDSSRHKYFNDIIWVKCIEILTCRHERAAVIFFIILCLAVLPIGSYGMFVWVTSLMEFAVMTKAVLIGFNFILGVLHDIIKLCKHY